MDAKEYVALAKRAVKPLWTEPDAADLAEHIDERFSVFADASVRIGVGPAPYGREPVLEVYLTRENTASESALVRALLASAVTVKRIPDDVDGDVFLASLAIEFASGSTETEARDALLDALLAETLTPRDCVCGGTGHTERGEPCDGPGGDGCLTDARNLADLKAQRAAH